MTDPTAITVPNVCAGVERDIVAIANGDKAILNGGLAHACRALATQLDNDPSATATANCVGELRKTLAELRELAPDVQVKDGLHDLAEARSARRLRIAGAEA